MICKKPVPTVAAIVLGLSLLAGCGKDDEDDEDDGLTNGDLVGTWQSACIASGALDDLAFVSPKSGGAVSRAAAVGYEDRLYALPEFLREGGMADWPDVFDALRITGHFLARDILVDRRSEPLAARTRLVDLMKRAVA